MNEKFESYDLCIDISTIVILLKIVKPVIFNAVSPSVLLPKI